MSGYVSVRERKREREAVRVKEIVREREAGIE